MIDESPAGDEFKHVMRGKLDALLGLAEATDCRRVQLLGYFGEASQPCGNCDNCLVPPETLDATEPARMLLSCIYRVHQATGMAFGAGHLMDILRGKTTDKVTQYGHERLSTFGIGAHLSETQWRSLLRQLIAREAVAVATDGFNTLSLTDGARAILRGEERLSLRVAQPPAAGGRQRNGSARRGAAVPKEETALDPAQTQALAALKAWRAGVAKEHNLPAFVIFHDSTLRALAQLQPVCLADLQGVAGVGQKKLETYGPQVLAVLTTDLKAQPA
jgi:ATP-dependent DNA helicase RecQ